MFVTKQLAEIVVKIEPYSSNKEFSVLSESTLSSQLSRVILPCQTHTESSILLDFSSSHNLHTIATSERRAEAGIITCFYWPISSGTICTQLRATRTNLYIFSLFSAIHAYIFVHIWEI